MSIPQMALIQSLGEAMAWFEREVEWGIPPTELRHLCGRIGELFVAVITNGRMANEVNQRGYDVVSANNQRISVKTTATVGNASHVVFNTKTLEFVDRVIVLRINTEEREIETLLDASREDAEKLMGVESGGKRSMAISKLITRIPSARKIKTLVEVEHENYKIRELENGGIEVELDGKLIVPVKPVLRGIADQYGLGSFNGAGNSYNTRQLGGLVIKSLIERNKQRH